MFFGVAYYPEHRPEERWPLDAQMMQAAGLNGVRMGEFAWSKLEPTPGESLTSTGSTGPSTCLDGTAFKR